MRKERRDRVEYLEKNRLHREDGPAVEWKNGEVEWYLNGKKLKIFKYKKNEVCWEICEKCKRYTLNGCIGGLEHCPYKMEQIVCSQEEAS